MPGDESYLVDEFLEALVAQLDRTQDALRFKAVNRPLTYAIKDFNLQLQVFVDLDPEGNIRLRSAGPNESGASTMSIAFTSITRPQIEENTITLAATRAPSLAEAGFRPAERKRLERLGITNTAQLQRLGATTGTSVVARLTSIPVDRLRAALQMGGPQITSVRPGGPEPIEPAPAAPPPAPPPSPAPAPRLGGPLPIIRLTPDATHLHLIGTALANEEGAPEVRLDGVPVRASEAEWDRVVVPVPAALESGTLEVTLTDGTTTAYELRREAPASNGELAGAAHQGSWRPEVE